MTQTLPEGTVWDGFMANGAYYKCALHDLENDLGKRGNFQDARIVSISFPFLSPFLFSFGFMGKAAVMRKK